MDSIDLSTNIGSLKLKNPIIAASGVFGYGLEYADLCPPEALGAVVTKGVSIEASEGNPPPRTWETPSGMLNAIGLENVGVDLFIKEKLPPLLERDATVIANFYGSNVDEYAEVARRLGRADGLAAIEANISCPNVGAKKGLYFGSMPSSAAQVTRAVKDATDRFLIVKLTPQVTDIAEVAVAVEEAGADAISLINTIPAMAVDVRTRKPRLANITGGLSGPAIHPVAVRMVWEVSKAVSIPVVGVGGVMTAEDALELIVVGASAVQVGTAIFPRPSAPLEIIDGMRSLLQQMNVPSISELSGSIKIDPS